MKTKNIVIDMDRFQVRVDGVNAKLSPKEFDLFKMIKEADGKVLSRDHLLKTLWGYTKSNNLETRTIDAHIARLRKKIPGVVGTMSTRGYHYIV